MRQRDQCSSNITGQMMIIKTMTMCLPRNTPIDRRGLSCHVHTNISTKRIEAQQRQNKVSVRQSTSQVLPMEEKVCKRCPYHLLGCLVSRSTESCWNRPQKKRASLQIMKPARGQSVDEDWAAIRLGNYTKRSSVS